MTTLQWYLLVDFNECSKLQRPDRHNGQRHQWRLIVLVTVLWRLTVSRLQYDWVLIVIPFQMPTHDTGLQCQMMLAFTVYYLTQCLPTSVPWHPGVPRALYTGAVIRQQKSKTKWRLYHSKSTILSLIQLQKKICWYQYLTVLTRKINTVVFTALKWQQSNK